MFLTGLPLVSLDAVRGARKRSRGLSLCLLRAQVAAHHHGRLRQVHRRCGSRALPFFAFFAFWVDDVIGGSRRAALTGARTTNLDAIGVRSAVRGSCGMRLGI